MVDAILQLKDPYAAGPTEMLRMLAAYALATFGQGGNPGSETVEGFVGQINTPVSGGYLRVRVGDAFGMALEHIEANGGCEYASLVRVEWPGVEYEPLTWDAADAEGNVTTEKVGGFV